MERNEMRLVSGTSVPIGKGRFGREAFVVVLPAIDSLDALAIPKHAP